VRTFTPIVVETIDDGELFLGMGEYSQRIYLDELILWFGVLLDDEHVIDEDRRVEEKVDKLLKTLYYGTVGYVVEKHTDEDDNAWVYARAHT
jgi:hypothetical protein